LGNQGGACRAFARPVPATGRCSTTGLTSAGLLPSRTLVLSVLAESLSEAPPRFTVSRYCASHQSLAVQSRPIGVRNIPELYPALRNPRYTSGQARSPRSTFRLSSGDGRAVPSRARRPFLAHGARSARGAGRMRCRLGSVSLRSVCATRFRLKRARNIMSEYASVGICCKDRHMARGGLDVSSLRLSKVHLLFHVPYYGNSV